MSKNSFINKHRTALVLVLFALAFLVVGAVLRSRMTNFLISYTENQTAKQAEVCALLMEEKLNTELEELDYIASRLQVNLYDMEDLMPRIYSDSGVKQGLLGIDGEALYGEPLDFSVFDGIQSSFRGKKEISYVEGQGLLFTCPVFNGPNIRYVLYRLCPPDVIESSFSTKVYDDLGKFCVATRSGDIIVPFYNATAEDIAFYNSEQIQREYASMLREMEISVAVAKNFRTDRGNEILFEAEIPETDFLIFGFVPLSVATEGIGNLTKLVVWVFGLLMLLVMMGAFYLTRVSIKIRESDELRHAKALAEEASRAKSDFLANMSHEIRTPINTVLGMNEMILRESSDDIITMYANNIRTAGNSLLGIINDILDFSKIEAGKIDIIPVEYQLSSVINDLVNMVETRADNKGLSLSLNFDPNLPSVLFGDEVRIEQIITNLLTNAVKYTEKGGVTFGITYEDVEDDKDSIMLNVYVKDSGIGIKPEEMDKLFSEFERIDEKRNRHIEGTGLGMSITTNLLKMMGSHLEVESIYGQGSTFRFALKQKVINREPMGDFETEYRDKLLERHRYHEKFTAPMARVLVVDDNNMNLMVFVSLIKQTRVRIDIASGGNEGIALTKMTKYHMVFLDHMMPEKDGIETLKEIRADAENPNADTPMICLTANAVSGAKEMYVSEGFDDYLTKPIDSGKLEDMMLHYLPKELIKVSDPDDEEDAQETAKSADAEEIRAVLVKLENANVDTAAGLKNSGSAESYMSMLNVFYESIDEKSGEIRRFYDEGDIKNYTIKVHALKSTAKLVGAMHLGELAQELENAGKADNLEFIKEHQAAFMEEYLGYKELLSGVLTQKEPDIERPEADETTMKTAFEEIRTAADAMDCDHLENIFDEMKEYSIPEKYAQLFKEVKDASDQYDYDMILELLERGIKEEL